MLKTSLNEREEEKKMIAQFVASLWLLEQVHLSITHPALPMRKMEGSAIFEDRI